MTVGTRARRPHVHATGAASTAVRPLLDAPRRAARVLAAFPAGAYLQVRTDREPSVIALLAPGATRLPNAVLLAGEPPRLTVGHEASVGDGAVRLGRLSLRASRWWDPAPPLGEADPAGLREAAAGLTPGEPALAGEPAVELLASGCASGRLLDVLTAAERLVGLGPGLTPSGDDVLAGLMVTLRLLGAATGAGRAVWLADWLAATVTYDARTRTTPLSATLLHCAALGQASPEVAAVLRALAGRGPVEPALRRLHGLGHTSGSDLAQGIGIGVRSVLAFCSQGSPSSSGDYT
ncbi:DUF2877 domain-containing protein [Nonomuraea sp. SMC257]|uniref:DUF2877 domain-containing protein n=1 Tax=Nonomuraea montanisoli TaxID=2741721 RepID=A0A7Y6I3T9_9ACTN|nr:DUF2877 domain-containing protein [Nonomuraea montanisoli]NUW31031.1 DUF2877 domain-containing protein [Nonomuraea montanisoli]